MAFKLCMTKEKEDEQIEIFMFCFLKLEKVSVFYKVGLAIEQQRDAVCKLLAFFSSGFHVAPPIPYVGIIL